MAYIGTWPSSVGFRTVDFKSISKTKITETLSGRKLRFSSAGTRFSATIRYPRMSVADFLPIQAIATQAQGPLNSFDIVLPTISDNSTAYGSATVTVDGNQSAGDSTIQVSTNQTSQTILKAGDVVRFASHTKVYMLTSDVTTDGAGDATLNITPSLFEDIVNNSTVTIDSVPFRMIMNNDLQVYKYGTDGYQSYEIDVVEEL